MELNISLVLLLICASQAFGQSSEALPENDPARLFTVQIRHFTYPNVTDAVFGCVGTLITFQHVLTSAVCVNRPANNVIVIHGRTTMNWVLENASFERVDRIHIHPDFNNNVQRVANVAVSRLQNALASNLYQPRPLGQIVTTNACSMIGWGGMQNALRRASLNITAPTNCFPDFPHSFCFDGELSPYHACGGYLGGPIICAGDAVAGIVIVDQFCGITPSGSFHSVGQFREWIEYVSGAEKIATKSVLLAFILTSIIKAIL